MFLTASEATLPFDNTLNNIQRIVLEFGEGSETKPASISALVCILY